jgi:hypothetical protein
MNLKPPAPAPASVPISVPISVPTQKIITPNTQILSVPIIHSPINIEDELTSQNLYKTELCRSFEETGNCRYGTKCQFAHGIIDLRPVMRHPKYKTEVCKTFHTIGTCPYGKRCRFIHVPPSQKLPGDKEMASEESFSSLNPINESSVTNSPRDLNETLTTTTLPTVSALPVSPIFALTVPAVSKPQQQVEIIETTQSKPEQRIETPFNTSAAFNYSDWGLNLQQVLGIPPVSDAFSTWTSTCNGSSSHDLQPNNSISGSTSQYKDSSQERRLAVFQQICC